MAKSKSWEIWLVGAIIVVAVLYSTGNLKVGNQAASIGTGQQTTITNQNCPSATQYFLTSVAYPDYTKSPVQQTLVTGQTVNIYSQTPTPSPTPTAVGYSSSSSANAISGLNCGYSYLLTSGDDTTYLKNFTTATLGTGINQPVSITVLRYTAPTVTVAATTQATPTSNTVVHTVSASQTKIVYLTIEAGQYVSSEGPLAVSFSYNSAAIQSIQISGLAPTGVAVPSMVFSSTNALATTYWVIGAQNSQVTYLMASPANYQYTTGTGTSIGAYQIPVQIVTTAAFTQNELIGVQVTPGTNFFNAATGQVNLNQFKNPLTNANLVAPALTNPTIALQTT